MAFDNLRYRYPDFGVRKAVSISASLPVMAPKKNSLGVSPLLKLFLINPLDLGLRSFFLKYDKVLSLNPVSIRFPRKACWPTTAVICAMLRGFPLDPHFAIVKAVLSRTWRMAMSPLLFRAL